jgi:hypothetical protein
VAAVLDNGDAAGVVDADEMVGADFGFRFGGFGRIWFEEDAGSCHFYVRMVEYTFHCSLVIFGNTTRHIHLFLHTHGQKPGFVLRQQALAFLVDFG